MHHVLHVLDASAVQVDRSSWWPRSAVQRDAWPEMYETEPCCSLRWYEVQSTARSHEGHELSTVL